MKRTLEKYKIQLALSLAWLFIILIVNPIGEFPLNDDWSYAKSVETLYYDGFLKLYNWGEMTLVAHVYWGYLFTKLFGFSFTVLRLSTLVMGLFSVLGIYQLCLLIQASKKIALMAALLCMFNPIFLSLSFSFMTDVPFFAISTWTFYTFLKYHKTQLKKYLLLAILLSIWAFLIRQLALVFPLAWLFACLLSNKKNILIAALPIVVLILFYFGFTAFMKAEGLLQERYNDKLGLLGRTLLEAKPKLLINIPGYFFVVLCYMGFFFAPLHWVSFKKPFQLRWAVFYTAIISTVLIATNKAIPSLDNVLVDFGVGPITLFDHYGNFTQSPSPNATQFLWWLITAVGVFFSFVWVQKLKELFSYLKKQKSSKLNESFSLFSSIIYLAPFLIVGIYDRYLLFLIPLFCLFLLGTKSIKTSRRFTTSSFVFISLLAIFSVCATHDYLSWNRVRWEVLTDLNKEGVPLNRIQGGVEFTAWHHFKEEDSEWWKAVEDEYILVFEEAPEYNTLKSYEYSRWLPGKGELYLVNKATN